MWTNSSQLPEDDDTGDPPPTVPQCSDDVATTPFFSAEGKMPTMRSKCDTMWTPCSQGPTTGCKVKVVMQPTLAELLDMKRERARQGDWVPANGGTETPFITRTHRRLLYCWQPSTGDHRYLDCDTDLLLSDEEARLALATD